MLQSLCTSAEGRAILLRSQLVDRAPPLILHAIDAGDNGRATAVLSFLANLAFAPEGQQALLRTDGFDAAVAALDGVSHAGAQHAAALCLRNLAFSPEGKASFLAKPPSLRALLHAACSSDVQLVRARAPSLPGPALATGPVGRSRLASLPRWR